MEKGNGTSQKVGGVVKEEGMRGGRESGDEGLNLWVVAL
jgi:hypothetical protein